MEVKINIYRSKRKTCSIQVCPDLSVAVKAPLVMTDKEIDRFIKKNENFIMNGLDEMRKRNEKISEMGRFTPEDIHTFAEKAMKVIPPRVKFFAEKLGVKYGRITIRNQKTKWGSCSSKGNLNFNCLLMETPPEVIDAVVAHEVCHLKHMNHSGDFYKDLYKIYPDYDKWNLWLKQNGEMLMLRMIG